MENKEIFDTFIPAFADMDSGQKRIMLDTLLMNMDVPEMRRNDLGWLTRNLAIRNSDHPAFELAESLIKSLHRS
jgi:hypothetical protein